MLLLGIRVTRFWFSTCVFTALAILEAKYVSLIFLIPPQKSLYFYKVIHCIADSHLLNMFSAFPVHDIQY